MALGVTLVVTVLLVFGVLEDVFGRKTSQGYHFIVGGKNGSKTDLVMSTVYHVRRADEPMPYSYYKEFITTADEDGNPQVGKFAGWVARAVPVCVGDNYEGYRVVATTPEMFDFELSGGRKYGYVQNRFEAVAMWW